MLGLVVYAAALLFAASSDLVRYQIPDEASWALAAGFLLFTTALPLHTSFLDVTAALAVLVVGAALFAFDLLGGGDVKLLSAIALWAGWSLMLPLLFLTSVAGAVLAVVLLAVRRFAPRKLPQGRWYWRLLARGEGVPYGIAIAIAGLLLLPRIAAPVLR